MWKLTCEFLTTEDPSGKPCNVSSTSYTEEKHASLLHRFRLLDDDNIVYGEGMSESCDDGKAFAPLDDFGMGAWGCTGIEYWQPSQQKWESL